MYVAGGFDDRQPRTGRERALRLVVSWLAPQPLSHCGHSHKAPHNPQITLASTEALGFTTTLGHRISAKSLAVLLGWGLTS